ncbi:MAG: hypothetical protein WD572_00015 [Gammaproteobacteria bacterium]
MLAIKPTPIQQGLTLTVFDGIEPATSVGSDTFQILYKIALSLRALTGKLL